ncbi:MAG TPA: cobalamin B12-binding domain-containing protein [Ktedonobacterales bacterium]
MLVREPRVQAPQLDSYSDTPLFNTKAVVHQTGVPAPTLRAWERRYGILAPRRGDNDYRLYSERDMAIVTWLHERIASGLTISQAIALLRSLEPSRRRGRRGKAGGSLAHEAPGAYEAHEAQGAYESETHVGAAAPAVQAPSEAFSLEVLSAALLTQFMHLDEASANGTIAQAFSVYSVEDVCLSLLTPTLIRLGELWQSGDITVTVEHFASALIRGYLEGLYRASPLNDAGPMLLIGCAPGEAHELGALMLALFLRRAGLRVVYLGQNVDPDTLIETVETIRPACLLLSAAMRPQAETLVEIGRRLTALGRPQPTFFFGGHAFAAEPDLARRIPGVYLELDAHAAAQDIKRRLTA